jgi:AraC-like DNA-binding protein
LKRAIEFIDAHLDSPLYASEVAKAIGLSANQFRQGFTTSVGISPHEYVIRKKIAIAIERLKNEDISLVDLALDLGFSSQPHFSTVFRERVGHTPSEFRQCQGGIELRIECDNCPLARRPS